MKKYKSIFENKIKDIYGNVSLHNNDNNVKYNQFNSLEIPTWVYDLYLKEEDINKFNIQKLNTIRSNSIPEKIVLYNNVFYTSKSISRKSIVHEQILIWMCYKVPGFAKQSNMEILMGLRGNNKRWDYLSSLKNIPFVPLQKSEENILKFSSSLDNLSNVKEDWKYILAKYKILNKLEGVTIELTLN